MDDAAVVLETHFEDQFFRIREAVLPHGEQSYRASLEDIDAEAGGDASTGRGGAFFFSTRDDRLMLKTISAAELRVLGELMRNDPPPRAPGADPDGADPGRADPDGAEPGGRASAASAPARSGAARSGAARSDARGLRVGGNAHAAPRGRRRPPDPDWRLSYPEYVRKHGNATLIMKMVGCVSMKMKEYGGHTVRFLVCCNVFPPRSAVRIDETYDLKGSVVNRTAAPLEEGAHAVCKHCHEPFVVVDADPVELYKKHVATRLRSAGTTSSAGRPVPDPADDVVPGGGGPSMPGGGSSLARRRASSASNVYCGSGSRYHEPVSLLKDNDLKSRVVLSGAACRRVKRQLGLDASWFRAHGIMDYSLLLGVVRARQPLKRPGGTLPDGGPAAFHGLYEERSRVLEGPARYYLGIIDCLQKYDKWKRLESMWKRFVLRREATSISSVDEDLYAARFLFFLDNIITQDALGEDENVAAEA
jgi:hypothetical protein